MKKQILVFLFLILSSICYAQHLRFMGIDMNCTVNVFTQKLKSKGIYISENNKYAPVGCRLFQGTFAGYKGKFLVNYNTKSAIVYSVRFTVSTDGYDFAKSVLDEFITSVDSKYINLKESSKTKGGDDITLFKIYHNDDDNDEMYYGEIYMGISDGSSGYNYDVNITYEDVSNTYKNALKDMNDY